MKRFLSILVAVCLIVCLFPALGVKTALAAETAVVSNPVATDRLHLRASPNAGATSYGRYYSGVVVTILEYTSQDWVKVRIGSGSGSATGYMQRRFLAFGNAGANVRPAIPTLYVNNKGASVNLRAGRTTTSASLGSYKHGTAVEMLAYGSTWYHVRIGGKTGFMQASFLTNSNPGSSGSGGSSGGSSSSGSIGSGSVGYVNNGSNGRLNLRSGAGTGYASLGRYYTGTPVTALSSPSNGWVKVRIGNSNQGSQTGYMMTQYLRFGGTISQGMPFIVNEDASVRMFDKPGLSSSVVNGGYYSGWQLWVGDRTELEVMGALSNDWLLVRIRSGYPNAGATGFIKHAPITY
ncbi:MAG: SH3 domain-containing protein [Oscillospiraceae bacterium]|nr:SH3 domain-containing protein [Oscillospiraceae bacterium]